MYMSVYMNKKLYFVLRIEKVSPKKKCVKNPIDTYKCKNEKSANR